MKRIYLDYAAAAPTMPKAKRAFLRALTAYGNPSSAHEEGRVAKKLLEEARTTIARLAGVKSEHITFTSGATEANALAIEGYAHALMVSGRAPGDIEFMYHGGAHSSVVRVMEKLAKEGVSITTVPTKNGAVDLEALSAKTRPQTALISLEAISPETGMRHDVRGVRNTLPKHVLLHVDASQLPTVESFERERLCADLLTLDAQKVGGVRGIGCLIRSSGVTLVPLLAGGGQEHGLRSGTESVALAVSFAVALQEAARTRDAFTKRSASMRIRLIKRIRTAIPSAVVLGGAHTAPHILALALSGRDTDYLQALLDKGGFAVGTKSACESDSSEGSRMARSETNDEALALSTLRVSWGPHTKEHDLITFADALQRAVRFLDTHTL